MFPPRGLSRKCRFCVQNTESNFLESHSVKSTFFVAWSLKWTVKDVISAFLFAYRYANKELRSRISSLHLSCLCLLCLRNLCVGWEVIEISNNLDDVSTWIIFVVLRSDWLRLVHCNFSSSIAKKIHLPIQFVVAKQIHLPIQFVVAKQIHLPIQFVVAKQIHLPIQFVVGART